MQVAGTGTHAHFHASCVPSTRCSSALDCRKGLNKREEEEYYSRYAVQVKSVVTKTKKEGKVSVKYREKGRASRPDRVREPQHFLERRKQGAWRGRVD